MGCGCGPYAAAAKQYSLEFVSSSCCPNGKDLIELILWHGVLCVPAKYTVALCCYPLSGSELHVLKLGIPGAEHLEKF